MSRRSVGANAVALYCAEGASRLLFVALTVLIARMLGAHGLGQLVFATSLAGIVQVLSEFGLPVYMVRTLAKEPLSRTELLPSIATLRFGTAAVATALAVVYALGTVHDGALLATTAFALGYVAISVYAEFVFSLYRVEETMQYEAVGRALRSLAYAGGGITIVALGGGVTAVVAWSCVAALATNAYAWWIGRGLSGFSARPSLRFALLRRAFVASLPFGILAVLTTISFRIDALMIQLIRGTTALGIYGSAYRSMEVLLILPAMLAAAVMPVIARSIAADVAYVMRLISDTIRLLWTLAFPLAAALALLGGNLLTAVFAGPFGRAAVVLALLGATLIPLFASGMTSVLIAAGARPQINAYIAAGMVALNVALNLALIPSLGIDGAGIATLATEAAGLVAGAVVISRDYGTIVWQRLALKPLLAAGAMSGVIVAFDRDLAAIPLYVVTYLVVLLLLRGLRRADLRLLAGDRGASASRLGDAVGQG